MPNSAFLLATLNEQRPNPSSGWTDGLNWQCRETGIIELTPIARANASIVLSAGIHGDETAPIEILDHLLHDLLHQALPLTVRLLIISGNPAAMRSGQRYLDDDLNRLFSGRHQTLANSREAGRAAEIERAVSRFFMAASQLPRQHLDLHTAIRPSLIERFGLLPHQAKAPCDAGLLAWLDGSGIDALIMQRSTSGTFCQYSCDQHAAASCTLELGKVQPFGQNDLSRFALMDEALRRLLSGLPPLERLAPPRRVFRVAREIIKQSDDFELLIDAGTPNFTPYPQGTPIARDGRTIYSVQHAEEWIVFPNSRVKRGLRAGLLLIEDPPG